MKQWKSALVAGLGTAGAVALLAMLEQFTMGTLWLMAPLGASAVLVFGLPDSPLAQPKNVIVGHLLTAFIGVCFVQWAGVSPVTLGLATGLAVSALFITNTTHPPAGANPLLVMLTDQSWWFLFSPVLIGAVILVIFARFYRHCYLSFTTTYR